METKRRCYQSSVWPMHKKLTLCAQGIVRHRASGGTEHRAGCGFSLQRSSSLMGAVGIVKDELLYTNRDWPLNSWALPPSTVPGMREAFANCLMNKSLNKSFQCLWRVVQLKHQRSSEEEEIPARWETHRILHGEGWLMESWKEEKMEIELSRWWFQQNQCHRDRKMGVKCTELIMIVHPLLSYLFTWADWCLCLQFPQSWSILSTSAGLIFLKHSYIMMALPLWEAYADSHHQLREVQAPKPVPKPLWSGHSVSEWTYHSSVSLSLCKTDFPALHYE